MTSFTKFTGGIYSEFRKRHLRRLVNFQMNLIHQCLRPTPSTNVEFSVNFYRRPSLESIIQFEIQLEISTVVCVRLTHFTCGQNFKNVSKRVKGSEIHTPDISAYSNTVGIDPWPSPRNIRYWDVLEAKTWFSMILRSLVICKFSPAIIFSPNIEKKWIF